MGAVPIWQKISGCRLYPGIAILGSAGSNDGALFADYELFLTPATAQTAPLIEEDLQSDTIRSELQEIERRTAAAAGDLIYQMFDKSLALTPYTQLANLTGQPAISLPTAVSEEGLPLGIQFMASKGREDLLFQVGELFERWEQFHLPKK